jgi:lipoprotein-anchoring transpeptidase ErfK/SrfK
MSALLRLRTTAVAAALLALACSATARADESVASHEVQLSGIANLTRWAYVLRPVAAHERPDATARSVGLVKAVTPEGATNLVVAYTAQRDANDMLWIRVPLARLPNGLTGWVPREALGDLHAIHTHLVIDRAHLTAVLLRNGRPEFRTGIGVGKPQWPTPRGEFYVRVRLRHFTDPMYGPVAFGTNAKQPWLTDWPEGGFVGIHGTDSPQLLPGRVSHGCIRLRNDAILRLARVMPLGTPVSIR